MAWVRIGVNGGDCIIVDGVAYGKVTVPPQPTSGAITATPDIINIIEREFDYDDSIVWGGNNHRTWSACEMGIALYGDGNQGSVTSHNSWANIYTALSAGMVRVYGQNDVSFRIKLNGTVLTTGASANGIKVSYPIGVVLGDVIDVYMNYGSDLTLFSIFLPNVYP
jgi:hypothetical protein